MPVTVAIVGGWILLNGALAAALLTRRERPRVRAKLVAWVLRGERRPARRLRPRPLHSGR
jgi:hypothetical protein